MRLFLVILLSLTGNIFFCQDIHLVNVFNTSIVTNPGNTGMIFGNQRAILSYRDQWSTAKSPYKTYFFAADAVFGKANKANLGLGLYVSRDNAGDLKMGNTQAMGSISAIVPLNYFSKLSMAVQGGYSQQSINTAGMQWDNQYGNGKYNAGASSGESFDFSPFGYVDFNAGITYYYNSKDVYNMGKNSTQQTEIEIGLATHHLLEPKYQYGPTTSRLYRNYIGYFNGIFWVRNTNYAFNPALLYARQGPYQEIGIGMMIRYKLKESARFTDFSKDMNLSVGGYYRFADAFAPSVFFEYHKYSIGFTFGLNHSYFRNATNYFAGYEVVLRFINF